LNPCGHVVDLIRSCYECDISLFADDVDQLTKIRWYFTEPGTPALPFDTPFSSRTWDIRENLVPDLGEKRARKWRGGLPPFPVSLGGPCGTEEQWNEGASVDDEIPDTWPGSLVPVCCPPPSPVGPGGIAWGGTLTHNLQRGGIAWGGEIDTGVIVSCCPSSAVPTELVFTVTSATGGCSCWAGFTVNLTYNPGGHNWTGSALDPCGFGETVFVGFGCQHNPPIPDQWFIGMNAGGYLIQGATSPIGTCAPFNVDIVANAVFPYNLCGGDGFGFLFINISPA